MSSRGVFFLDSSSLVNKEDKDGGGSVVVVVVVSSERELQGEIRERKKVTGRAFKEQGNICWP